jgi:hypothetical protein
MFPIVKSTVPEFSTNGLGKSSKNWNIEIGNSKQGARQKPNLFSLVVKNDTRDIRKNDGINGNGGRDNGKTIGGNGWKDFNRKSNATTKQNRIS